MHIREPNAKYLCAAFNPYIRYKNSLILLIILLFHVKIRKPVFISVKHLSVPGAPGGCNYSVPSSSLGWPPLRFSFATMIAWFSYQINYIIMCCWSDVDNFLTIFYSGLQFIQPPIKTFLKSYTWFQPGLSVSELSLIVIYF